MDQDRLRLAGSARPHRGESTAWVAVILALAAWRFGGTVADPDLWGRLRFGLDRLEAGTFFYSDMYSYLTAGQTMYDHDWLTANSMALLYQAFGPAGLVVAKAVLALGLVLGLSLWLLRCGVRPTRMAMVMAIGVLALAPTLGTFRPQILTTVLFTLVLLVVVLVQEGRTRLVIALPLIFVLWVNLHGGVLAGVAVVGLWALLFALKERGGHRWMPVLAWALGVAGLSLNPLGYDLIVFLVETTSVDRPEILDWLPVRLASPEGFAYMALAILVLTVVWRNRRVAIWPIWIPLAGLVVSPLVATRHLQLFVPAVVVLGGWIYAGGCTTTNAHDEAALAGPHGRRIWTSLAVVVSLVTGLLVVRQADCLAIDADQFAFPARAIDAIPYGTSGNAIVPFNWGEYVIWWRGKDLRVSTDGRRETAYSSKVHQMNLDFINGEGPAWDRLLDAGEVDLMLIPSNAQGTVLMESNPDWARIYQDGYATILAPRSAPLVLEPNDSIPADSDDLCFPETRPAPDS